MANANITVTESKSNLTAETIKDAFGRSAVDVLLPLASASDVCSWLEAIVSAIRSEARKERPCSINIGNLASAAHYIASDFANYYDCEHAEMFERLKKSGVIAAEENRHV